MTLHDGTVFENGEFNARNRNACTPLRMADLPEFDIKLMESDEFPTGLGESTAYCGATGHR